MNAITRLAERHLRSIGWSVIAPSAQPQPGMTWVPTRTKARPRLVWRVGGGLVHYGGHGVEYAASNGSWHRWRRRTRASPQASRV